jgi:hypothetical protein
MVCFHCCCLKKREKEYETEKIKLEKEHIRYYNTCIPLHEVINNIVIKIHSLFKRNKKQKLERYTEYL